MLATTLGTSRFGPKLKAEVALSQTGKNIFQDLLSSIHLYYNPCVYQKSVLGDNRSSVGLRLPIAS